MYDTGLRCQVDPDLPYFVPYFALTQRLSQRARAYDVLAEGPRMMVA